MESTVLPDRSTNVNPGLGWKQTWKPETPVLPERALVRVIVAMVAEPVVFWRSMTAPLVGVYVLHAVVYGF